MWEFSLYKLRNLILKYKYCTEQHSSQLHFKILNNLVSVNYKQVFLFKRLTLFCSCFTIGTTLENKNRWQYFFLFFLNYCTCITVQRGYVFISCYPDREGDLTKNFDIPGCNTRQALNRAFDFTVLYASSADLNARWKLNQDPHFEKKKENTHTPITIPVTSMPEHVHNLIILTSGLALAVHWSLCLHFLVHSQLNSKSSYFSELVHQACLVPVPWARVVPVTYLQGYCVNW